MGYFLKASMTSGIFGLLLIISHFSFGQNTISLFVSPGGSDTANGTMEQPFSSIKKALKSVVEQRAKGKNDAVTIYLRAGTYYRTSSTEISKETLGGPNNGKIVIRPYQDEQVVFHGGKKINGGKFKKTKSRSILARLPQESQGKVWEIDLKKEGITNYGEIKQHGFGTPPSPTVMELFIDGQPQHLARYPNSGKLAIGKIYDIGSIPRDGDFSNRGGEFGFEYERPERWKKASDIWLHGKFSFGYNDDHLAVERIDYSKKTIKLKQPHLYGLKTSTPAYIDSTQWKELAGLSVRGFYAYNLLEEIDQPGEYYLNRNTGKLYLYPEGDLEGADVEVSLTRFPFFEIKNTSNIHFENLSFTCARGMAIYLENISDITIDSCRFSNLGTVAISMARPMMNSQRDYNVDGSPKPTPPRPGNFTNVTISNCKVYQTGTGGVIISGGDRKNLIPGNNRVINTEFYVNERINQTYSPSVRMSGVGNTIKNCYFHDLYHQAIQFSGNDHKIEYNHFDKVCKEADDMGPIYTGRNPSARGTVIRYNYFSNIIPPNPETSMCGVYLDDGSGGMTISNNFFYKVGNPGHNQNFGAVFIHGGHDNLIEGNVFMDCPVAIGNGHWSNEKFLRYMNENPIIRQRLKEHVDIDSPLYQERYPGLKDFFTTTTDRFNTLKHNVFIRSQTSQHGYFKLIKNATLNDVGESPEKVDWQKIMDYNKNIKPFPFHKVGIQEQ